MIKQDKLGDVNSCFLCFDLDYMSVTDLPPDFEALLDCEDKTKNDHLTIASPPYCDITVRLFCETTVHKIFFKKICLEALSFQQNFTNLLLILLNC